MEAYGADPIEYPRLVKTIAAALDAETEACCKVVCWMCDEGYPLQKNGAWHNDKDGKDCLVSNSCRAAAIRQRKGAR